VAGKSIDQDQKLLVALPKDIKNIVNLMSITPKRYRRKIGKVVKQPLH
jgi:hypothetical protein